MKVLILGSGGREHALANAIAASPFLTQLIVAPGNPGIAEVARTVPLDLADMPRVVNLAKMEGVDLVVVGPEAPLVAGLADELRKAGIACFGPSKEAARLEGSKAYTKELCREKNIPTAAWGRFRMPEAAIAFARAYGAPIVVKADGLAAGKGVVVALSLEEAEAAIRDILGGRFGEAGASLVVEEFLAGEEVSFFALCDGERAIPLGSAQDHKRVGDGDTGPNTGGMGAYSPAPIMTPALEARVMAEIVEPALEGMRERGAPFAGVLFAGLMISPKGDPRLIEFNVRFGDPETQAILPRLEEDLLPLLAAAARGELSGLAPRLKPQAALTVVMAAQGYPEAPQKGAPIAGLDAARENGAVVTHAGTALESGALVSAGGRVLNVTALGETVAAAQAAAYAALDRIEAPGLFARRDIGWRALAAPSAQAVGAEPARKSAREPEQERASAPEPRAAEANVGQAGADAVAAALLDLDFDFGEPEA